MSLPAEASTARELGDRPLVVLTSMKPMSADERKAARVTEEQAEKQKKLRLEMHQEETRRSPAGRQIVLTDASHYVQFDRPDVVISAVGRRHGGADGRRELSRAAATWCTACAALSPPTFP
jgi:hypothetical protein